jgi:hypothetical protein
MLVKQRFIIIKPNPAPGKSKNSIPITERQTAELAEFAEEKMQKNTEPKSQAPETRFDATFSFPFFRNSDF